LVLTTNGFKIAPFPAYSADAAPADSVCAFTVDVEDWYQSSVDYDAPISRRVIGNCARLLGVLDEAGVKATFFVQGRVAETYPELVRDLLREGHEIQSHGYSHRPLHMMSTAELKRELEFAVKTVEDAAGVAVTAFRAQDFSILKSNVGALQVLADLGVKVDSSIFPMRTKRYGISGWNAAPVKVTMPGGQSILEVPVAVWRFAGVPIPVAGGGYFRLLPTAFLERAFRSIMASGRPVVVYCHPYEFNSAELDEFRGRVPEFFRRTQAMGRAAFVQRVRRLFQAMKFTRFDTVLSRYGLR
jgi:polysaccharide deacetylase family protein (PEP-CTERM system associated)